MTNAEMHAIQVEDTPVFLQRTLTPGIKLLGERLVQTADCAGTRSKTHQGLGYFSYFVGTHPSDKHLGKSFSNVRFIATVAFKRLGVELAFPVFGHLEIFDSTRRCRQITRVSPIAIPFSFGTALTPRSSNEGI